MFGSLLIFFISTAEVIIYNNHHLLFVFTVVVLKIDINFYKSKQNNNNHNLNHNLSSIITTISSATTFNMNTRTSYRITLRYRCSSHIDYFTLYYRSFPTNNVAE